ncbi:MAG: pyridoxine 5'-phosphate synthase [Betaproteobacteria bacterium]
MTVLSVNLNKVALLRNQRDLDLPNVLRTGRICLDAGAHGLTLHPRPDQRHARPQDVFDMSELIETRRQTQPELEFNVEGNPLPEFLDLVLAVRPQQCTLVPDAPEARTSSEGWNVEQDGARLKDVVARLHEYGIRVSVFLNPEIAQVELAPATGVDRIEFYTEPYAAAFATPRRDAVTQQYAEVVRRAQALGLGVNAGHDLNLDNLGHLCRMAPGILEVSIGHAITADALEMGWTNAVRAYRAVLAGGQP